MRIRLIAAGGTFDKVYDPITGTLVFDQTTLPGIAKRARLGPEIRIEQAMLIDSLEMDDGHRRRLLALCRDALELRLVVVHGTDTIVQTAQVLAEAKLDKTIVLTGAMVPYRTADSDALFNLGYAIGAASHAAAGVYVAINGRTWPWNQVRKNRLQGRFEDLHTGFEPGFEPELGPHRSDGTG